MKRNLINIDERLIELDSEYNDLKYLKEVVEDFNKKNDNFLEMKMYCTLYVFIQCSINSSELLDNLNKFLKQNSQYYLHDYKHYHDLRFGHDYRDISRSHFRPVAKLLESFMDMEYEMYGC